VYLADGPPALAPLLEFAGAVLVAAGCGVTLPLLDAGLLCAEIFEDDTVPDIKRNTTTRRNNPARMEALQRSKR
jgi:hypothetical protein